jgi:hypothetical protein
MVTQQHAYHQALPLIYQAFSCPQGQGGVRW